MKNNLNNLRAEPLLKGETPLATPDVEKAILLSLETFLENLKEIKLTEKPFSEIKKVMDQKRLMFWETLDKEIISIALKWDKNIPIMEYFDMEFINLLMNIINVIKRKVLEINFIEIRGEKK